MFLTLEPSSKLERTGNNELSRTALGALTLSLVVAFNWFTSNGIVTLRIISVVSAMHTHLTTHHRRGEEAAHQADDPSEQIPNLTAKSSELTSSAR